MGYNPTDLITRTKIDESSVHPLSLMPNFRKKPNPKYLKRIIAKFNRSRHGVHQLCPDKTILTPEINIRIFKTLQRSNLLYAIEFCNWDIDQINKLEVLQAKALRCHLGCDLQCPKSILRLVCGVEPILARRDLHVLLYYSKLYNSTPNSLLGQMHQYRTKTFKSLSVGFYATVHHILIKYNLEHYWDNIPDVSHGELKNILKKTIWSLHWKKDVAMALTKDSPFSCTFLPHVQLPTYPYKSNNFLVHFNVNRFPRSALSMILRFWLTPNRIRLSSCMKQTNSLAKHLLFSCCNTRDQIAIYVATLLNELSPLFCPSRLPQFFQHVAKSKIHLENFNLVISRFEYPWY